MKNYSTARTFIGVIEVIGWIVVGLSALAFMSSVGRGGMPALMLSLPIAVSGLALIAVAQITRAQIDTAENTARILSLMEANIRNTPASNSNAQSTPRSTAPSGNVVKTYRGQTITQAPGGYVAVGEHHSGVIAAEKAIDRALDTK